MADIRNLRDEVNQNRKPRASLPSKRIESKILLFDVAYTKKAREVAETEQRPPNLLDGIAAKLVILEYVGQNKEGKPEKKICVDFSNPDDIKFPHDYTDPQGNTDYAGIEASLYFTPKTVSSRFNPGGALNEPSDERMAALFYNASFEAQFQKDGFELLKPILHCDIAADKENVSYKAFGFEVDGMSIPKMFPIISCYRTTDWSYDKSDLDLNRKPKPDAKPRFKQYFGVWNADEKNADIGKVATSWLPEETVLKIMNALVDRANKRKKPDDTPF